jgi:aspartate/methionine/tyrosine aminotransferase
MDFEPFALYDWLLEHEDHVKHPLAASGVKSVTLGELGVDPKVLVESDLGYGPLPAHPALRSKVASIYGFPEEKVLITLAGSEADLVSFAAMLKPGDKVVVENPTYPPLRAVPKALGMRVVLHERTWKNKFKLDLAKLDAQLKGAKLFVFTNLNNPTGVSTSPRELEELGEIARRRKCRVLVDEAFRELAFQPPPVAGLRTGWMLGPESVVRRARLAKTYMSIGQAPLEQRIALVALEKRSWLLQRAAALRDQNLSKIKPWMETHGKLRWVTPEGGPISYPRLPDGVDDLAFAQRLLREHSTLVVPGRYQGVRGHFRLGLGADPAPTPGGLEAIDAVLGTRASSKASKPASKPAAKPAPKAAAAKSMREDDLLEEHLGTPGGDV